MKASQWILLVVFSGFFIGGCTKEAVVHLPDEEELVYDPTPYELDLPDYMPLIKVPEDNPMTVEGVELGRRLFYDPILSADSTQSCASCHQQQYSFNDNRQFSVGIDGIAGPRNAMPIINIMWAKQLFWDGRSTGAEAQALEPVENPIEMHDNWNNVVNKLQQHPSYPQQFYEAFGIKEFTKAEVAKAIAQFERTLISANSPYDKVYRQELGNFFTDEQLNGFQIFNTERGDCFHCHSSILFTDNAFHNNGLDNVPQDVGLGAITGMEKDMGKFKTPTLRNIELTAPYMHDGRFETLEEVINFYSEGLQNSPTIDPLMKNIHGGGLQLTAKEKSDLLAFLHTLTDTSFIQNEAFANPFE